MMVAKVMSIVCGDVLWENGECSAISGGGCDVLDGLGVIVFWVKVLCIVSVSMPFAVMEYGAGKLMGRTDFDMPLYHGYFVYWRHDQ